MEVQLAIRSSLATVGLLSQPYYYNSSDILRTQNVILLVSFLDIPKRDQIYLVDSLGFEWQWRFLPPKILFDRLTLFEFNFLAFDCLRTVTVRSQSVSCVQENKQR